jgi:hypothetical protein
MPGGLSYSVTCGFGIKSVCTFQMWQPRAHIRKALWYQVTIQLAETLFSFTLAGLSCACGLLVQALNHSKFLHDCLWCDYFDITYASMAYQGLESLLILVLQCCVCAKYMVNILLFVFFLLCPSTGNLNNTREHNLPETGSVSETLCSLVFFSVL